MLRDRGTIKWTAMMLPEHVQSIKEILAEAKKIKMPILEEDKIREMELLLLEGIEYNLLLHFDIFKNGAILSISGKTTYIDHLNQELRIQDINNQTHSIPFHSLVNIQNDY
ncbi:YolD-like family protein [Niallia sp.]|uniref:YolD-like family protein n=1 Tax=Niallia sp. TaxID=2837523 RepID=UPI00289963A2|nr:YolD-like family protein [Niallia sp.]